MPKISMMKAPEGKVPRGRTIRLYPTLEQKQHMRLVQDEARAAWNHLVGMYNAAVRAQYEKAESDGLIGPKPERLASDAGQEAWQAYYKIFNERSKLARAHSPELRMAIPKTDAPTYNMLMAEWAKTGKKRRMTANMYQALIQDFGRAMLPKKGAVKWRPPRRRKDTDDMPIRTGSGICVKPSGDKKRNALVSLPGLGWLLGIAHRDLDLMVKGSIVQGVAFREHTDGWYAAVRIYTDPEQEIVPTIKGSVGVDIGSDYLIVTSDGYRVENPKNKIVDVELPKEGPLPRIKRMPITGFKEGGRVDNRWRESPERALTRRARHIGCLIDVMVKHLLQYEIVLLESERPGVDNVPKNKKADPYYMAPGRVWTALKNRLGDRLKLVSPHCTSQICSRCGHRDKEAWTRRTGDDGHAKVCTCTACGFRLDRDINAAINIRELYVNGSFGNTGDSEPSNPERVSA